jgi:uncharacterized phosphosugar-binding protein
MPTPMDQYLDRCAAILGRVRAQAQQIGQAADWCAETILAGRMVHVFGSGHSRIMVEELWPRYGSFPGFNPIVELSLTFHNLVVGANGQRQAMFLENVSGLAERILRNFSLDPRDTALVISSSGSNVVPIEMALGFKRAGVRTIALVSLEHALMRGQVAGGLVASGLVAGGLVGGEPGDQATRLPDTSLHEVCDLVLDTGAPPGDALVWIDGLETPVAPGSTVGGCLVVNCLKAEIAQRLTQAGQPPKVLTSAVHVGEQRSAQLFEVAYDEHARRLARLYERE